MPRLHFVADVINHYEELIQNCPVRSSNANNIGNRLCLQHLVSVVKCIAERGLTFRDDENVGSPKKFFQTIFKTFQSSIKRCEASSGWFATVSQVANHCQMSCCII